MRPLASMKVQPKLASRPLRRQGRTLAERLLRPMSPALRAGGALPAGWAERMLSVHRKPFHQRTIAARGFAAKGFFPSFWVDDTFGYAAFGSSKVGLSFQLSRFVTE